jgi:uncharacterized membrane protein YphA (DoxX/SURF4 family)
VLTVAALVALRLSLGCHFLYEGVWKIKHHDEFTAEPFLTQAKGPLAPLFYAMVYDIDGRQRLKINYNESTGEKWVSSAALETRWDNLRERFLDFYKPKANADVQVNADYENLKTHAEATYKRYLTSAQDYLAENLDEIEAYLASLDRFAANPEKGQKAPFQQEQTWNKRRGLWGQAAGWLTELESREESYKNALRDLLTIDQQERGGLSESWSASRWTRMQWLNLAVTCALTAIGFCLMVGFFTRLAALGGAAFMAFVVATTWPWPTLYPPDPPVVGHALMIGKDFIEMMALLVVSTTAVGRWGGLDFFVHNLVFKPFLSKIRKSAP